MLILNVHTFIRPVLENAFCNCLSLLFITVLTCCYRLKPAVLILICKKKKRTFEKFNKFKDCRTSFFSEPFWFLFEKKKEEKKKKNIWKI